MVYESPFPDVEIPDLSLPQFVMQDFADRADQPALVDGPSGRTLTYGQLAGAIRKAAAGLHARGLREGDVFAIYSPNLPEYAIAFYGAAMAGGINTTVNPLYTPDECAKQLKDAGAKFLLTVPPFLDKAQQAAAQSGVDEVFVFGEAEGATPFRALLTDDHEVPDVLVNPAEDLVALPYSSGTTGLPKGVMLSHRNIVGNIAQCCPIEGIQEGEVTVGILPFYHIYGMTIILSMALYRGATIITMPKFEMEDFLGLVQEHKIESGYLVPPIILGLAKHPIVDEYDVSSLDYITSGAAPLPASVAQGCAERIGCVVKQGYGMTELSPVSHLMPRDHEKLNVDSVGWAVPNTEFRIVEVGSRTDVDTGERGELWVRGPQVMQGYWNNRDATDATVDADGWLHTGDVATLDAAGRLYIVDRVKELIKYKGYQVAPAELEGVVQAHDAVADAAVIPSPDEEAGEVPKAFVVLKPGMEVSAEDLMAFVAERVAPYKKIRRVEFIESIPKTASGKILRRDLVKKERGAAATS
ncbi:MAG: AMP-binding protein [Bacteroidetes bacterium]|jgi:acyl-CoA synthetase (AMP-forming)/AMP-acid ligase II|nr:AMP-binding protein [Bacteroidota bacterium]